jgi:hypothetical protein
VQRSGQVSVTVPEERLVGAPLRLDPDGRLVVATDGAESIVGAGDVVHVR